jgi:HSP20 family protein
MTSPVRQGMNRVPRLLERLEAEWPFGAGGRPAHPEHELRCEQYVEDGRVVVRAELAGFDPDRDVEVTVRDGTLRIAAARRDERREHSYSEFFYGRLVRTMTLPPGADQDAVTASYHDGILEVVVPVQRGRAEPRRVPITRIA